MLIAVAAAVVGLVLLTYASDQFVVGATRVAAALRISAVTIGAVVIGFGTSAPELVVSGLAARRGQLDLAVGNVIGSNIANLTLVLGAAALVTALGVRSRTLKREAPLSLGLVLLFALLIQTELTLLHGVALSAALAGALTVVVISGRGGDEALTAEVSAYLTSALPPLRREIARTLVSLVVVVAAAQVLIVSVTRIAEGLGLTEGFVGVTIVAIGTSLPELATALQAARRGEVDLLVGNLLGSNLFNAGAVGAIVAFMGTGQSVAPTLTGYPTLLMVAAAALSLAFMVTRSRVARWEGALLLGGYLAALPFIAR